MPLNTDFRLLGQRFTSQRKLLLDIIRDAGGHLDADELYRLAREKESNISLATVYRNLRLFKDWGLIVERHFAEGHHHYEIKNSAEHYHLICLGCGAVIEFHSPLTDEIVNVAEEESRFRIVDIEISMKGYCPGCQGGDGAG